MSAFPAQTFWTPSKPTSLATTPPAAQTWRRMLPAPTLSLWVLSSPPRTGRMARHWSCTTSLGRRQRPLALLGGCRPWSCGPSRRVASSRFPTPHGTSTRSTPRRRKRVAWCTASLASSPPTGTGCTTRRRTQWTKRGCVSARRWSCHPFSARGTVLGFSKPCTRQPGTTPKFWMCLQRIPPPTFRPSVTSLTSPWCVTGGTWTPSVRGSTPPSPSSGSDTSSRTPR
mmetsp:Transcript_8778/g.20527  ORF Transcript_8778/g.20527 Transcript_8778/m.20527 type:complete len:227 (+) Transcript_8778:498-1178(+)